MKYFYEYKIKNGAKVGGHNLEKIIIKDDVIILEGVDTLMDCDGEYDHHWRSIINEGKIEYLKIEPMEEEDKPIIEKLNIENDSPTHFYITNEYGTKCSLTKHSKMIADKLNEIIDYINRKEDK